MTGAECLLRTLTANGIEICFMNPGTSEMQFVAALDRVPGMRGVLCLFEGVCSGAADGYARMTGKPAATLLHLGPGLANGLANFHNARKARSPIVSIVGEHSTQHLKYDAPLSADIETFARSVTADVFTVPSAAEMGRFTSDAIAAAIRAPGQIAMLLIPADFSWSEAGEVGRAVVPPKPNEPNSMRADAIRPLLKSGPKTGFILGGRTLVGKSLDAAGRLAAQTGVRIFANRNAGRFESGRGCFQPERIPYFPEPAEATLAGLQHLVLVESAAPVSFFGYPGQRSYLAPDSCAVHVLAGIDEDGGAALLMLAEDAPHHNWTQEPLHAVPITAPLTLEALGRTVASLLPEDAIVCDEMISSAEPVGRCLLRAARHDYLPVTGGSIGQGMPVAVGAAFACPGRKVVALEADGSGMYTLQALWTMAREKLNVAVVIFANRRYRILDVEMKRTGANGFGPAANSMMDIGSPDIDWVRLGEGLGVPSVRASTAEEFHRQFAEAVQQRGPRLIEAVLPGDA